MKIKSFYGIKVLSIGEPFILPSGQKNKSYNCVCHCGKAFRARALHYERGKVTSCGCSRKGKSGLSKIGVNLKLRKLWRAIKYRCQKNHIDKHVYFDRGIKVCDEWIKDYYLFEKWAIDNGWNEQLQIDRIDNEKGYCPENCRFVTSTENGRNKRNSIIVEYNGEKIHLRNLLERERPELKPITVIARMKRGWTLEEAIKLPLIKSGRNKNGEWTKVKL